MAAVGDTVLYLTPETPEQPSTLIPAVLTGTREDGAVILLQGAFFLGYAVAQQYDPQNPEPMLPGEWMEKPDVS